jgi:broad specificity phosphatase PhoE
MLTLVRHGRTETNAAGLLLGRADPPLDDVGRAQVDAVAARLGSPLGMIVSSPLRRARETAARLAAGPDHGVPVDVVVDERWIELDYGAYEGVPFGDVPVDVWAHWRTDPSYAPPDGESLGTLAARVAQACESLVDLARNGEVVVVTHVSPIKAALAWALGVGVEISWRTYVAPASITRIAVGRVSPTLHSFNECPWAT